MEYTKRVTTVPAQAGYSVFYFEFADIKAEAESMLSGLHSKLDWHGIIAWSIYEQEDEEGVVDFDVRPITIVTYSSADPCIIAHPDGKFSLGTGLYKFKDFASCLQHIVEVRMVSAIRGQGNGSTL
jgi:hypothetical protein